MGTGEETANQWCHCVHLPSLCVRVIGVSVCAYVVCGVCVLCVVSVCACVIVCMLHCVWCCGCVCVCVSEGYGYVGVLCVVCCEYVCEREERERGKEVDQISSL